MREVLDPDASLLEGGLGFWCGVVRVCSAIQSPGAQKSRISQEGLLRSGCIHSRLANGFTVQRKEPLSTQLLSCQSSDDHCSWASGPGSLIAGQ